MPRILGIAPDFALYTDASTSTFRIADLLSQWAALPPKVQLLAVSTVPKFRAHRFHDKP